MTRKWYLSKNTFYYVYSFDILHLYSFFSIFWCKYINIHNLIITNNDQNSKKLELLPFVNKILTNKNHRNLQIVSMKLVRNFDNKWKINTLRSNSSQFYSLKTSLFPFFIGDLISKFHNISR